MQTSNGLRSNLNGQKMWMKDKEHGGACDKWQGAHRADIQIGNFCQHHNG